MNIEGIDKAELLAALYNGSEPLGFGFLHATKKDMTYDEARAILDNGDLEFDYLKGRVMKIDLSEEKNFETRLYNRDNGYMAAERIIKNIIQKDKH